MHATTEALLTALSKTSDDNDLTPLECWHEIGPFIYEWRQAGKPDLPTVASPPRDCKRCGHAIIEDFCLCGSWERERQAEGSNGGVPA